MSKNPKPTPAELEVLQVLWANGPSTVREVFGEITKTREVAYTTALKTLQVMLEKGLVTREEQGKGHAYSATETEENTQRSLVDDFLDRAFGGAAQKLVLQALQSRKSTKEELKEIRDLLDKLEEK
jgi:BlaI family transcriptional regulator, penicillinase repressor